MLVADWQYTGGAHGNVDFRSRNLLMRNGQLIEAGSSEAITIAIESALANREALVAMRPAALASAAAWQWSDYRQGIREALAGSLS